MPRSRSSSPTRSRSYERDNSPFLKSTSPFLPVSIGRKNEGRLEPKREFSLKGSGSSPRRQSKSTSPSPRSGSSSRDKSSNSQLIRGRSRSFERLRGFASEREPRSRPHVQRTHSRDNKRGSQSKVPRPIEGIEAHGSPPLGRSHSPTLGRRRNRSRGSPNRKSKGRNRSRSIEQESQHSSRESRQSDSRLSPRQQNFSRNRTSKEYYKQKERSSRHRRSLSVSLERGQKYRKLKRKRSSSIYTDSEDSELSNSESSVSSSYESHQKLSNHKKREEKLKKKDKRKSDKKNKKKKENKLKAVTNQWGKYGVIADTEYELNLWLLEEKKLNPEAVSLPLMKEHFRQFVEADYNTATLPHKKYYNLEKWDEEQRAKRQSARYVEEEGGIVDFKKDEEELRKQHRQQVRIPIATAPLLTKDQVLELKRVTTERIQAERLRKMGYTPKESMGVRYE
ncbi:hypothetical protein G9A89_001887 [Geosiphon pyriformis]|nr:hypothetical protein G9A89_001887 [Geosiphon pyriformis]